MVYLDCLEIFFLTHWGACHGSGELFHCMFFRSSPVQPYLPPWYSTIILNVLFGVCYMDLCHIFLWTHTVNTAMLFVDYFFLPNMRSTLSLSLQGMECINWLEKGGNNIRKLHSRKTYCIFLLQSCKPTGLNRRTDLDLYY